MAAIHPGTGHKHGERHHRSKCSNFIVDEACDMHDNDEGGYLTIARKLSAKHSQRIGASTVRDWVNSRTRAAA